VKACECGHEWDEHDETQGCTVDLGAGLFPEPCPCFHYDENPDDPEED
jgi:hypothetical protein